MRHTQVLCCHFTSALGVWYILADDSLGLRASDVGQLGGGLSVCTKGPHELGWEQYGRGSFRATVGSELWGEKAADVLLGNSVLEQPAGKDADKVEFVLIIKLKRIVAEDKTRQLPGRNAVLIIHPEDLVCGPDGRHYLEKQHIVKVWRLHNPDQELRNRLDRCVGLALVLISAHLRSRVHPVFMPWLPNVVAGKRR